MENHEVIITDGEHKGKTGVLQNHPVGVGGYYGVHRIALGDEKIILYRKQFRLATDKEIAMSTKGAAGIKECSSHGEFHADAEDSPCPSCEDNVRFCMFCEMEAEYMINDIVLGRRSKPAPICPACKQVYVQGQSSPDAVFTEIEMALD